MIGGWWGLDMEAPPTSMGGGGTVVHPCHQHSTLLECCLTLQDQEGDTLDQSAFDGSLGQLKPSINPDSPEVRYVTRVVPGDQCQTPPSTA